MNRSFRLSAVCILAGFATRIESDLYAAPYASNVTVTGLDVSFILNEAAGNLQYRVNTGAWQMLDATTRGTKTFMLGNAADTFDILTSKTDTIGYTIPTGGTPIAGGVNGLNESSPEAGLRIISDDSSLLNRFNSPRGVSVSNDPNATNFGTTYIGNSAAGSTAAPVRTLGDGIYALRADQSDAFLYGDTAQNPLMPDNSPGFFGNSSSGPWRMFVAKDGTVYGTDWSDVNGNVIQLTPDLLSGINVLEGFGGTAPLPTVPTVQNHGSIPAVYVEGSTAAGNLVVYTIDEDLTTAHITGSGATDDQNSLWKYEIGSGTLPSTVTPTKFADVLIPLPNADMQRGTDGKWYVMQSRFGVANEASLFVLSPDGSTVLFDSLDATRTIKNDPLFDRDILQYANAVAVSEDQKWVALMLNGSDIAVIPLVNGIPDLANRMVINSGSINSGRDIAFDAAGNIHYLSSGHARYQVLSPGGTTFALTSFNGTDYDFSIGPTDPFAPDVLVGDYNDDGFVNAADYAVWRDNLGSPSLSDGRDPNNTGPVDDDDYDSWYAQFGESTGSGSATAIPEPGVCALLLAAGLVWCVHRRIFN